MRSLGVVLKERFVVDDATIAKALSLQKTRGGRLGDILIGSGFVGTFDLYKAVAEHYGLRFVDLLKEPVDAKLAKIKFLEEYIKYKVLPWRSELGTVTFATSEPSEDLDDFISRIHGDDYKLVITSPRDIRINIEQIFADELKNSSANGLYEKQPEFSAKTTLNKSQKLFLSSIFTACILAFAISPLAAILEFFVFFHLLYAFNMLAKIFWYFIGLRRMEQLQKQPKTEFVPEKDLPIYSILIPLYKEAEVLPKLLSCIYNLDYPKEKLDVKLVLEADDLETYAAAKNLSPNYNFDIIRVPDCQPKTKPKALNYALRFAKGDLVTIYDAEDRPESDQLKKAASEFAKGDLKLVCLQARLNYYNSDENLLTRWFEIEYQTLFGPLLHALVGSRVPIPLGGTSNHINLRVLRSLGEWDPFNVTEDADLGVRLSTNGYKVAMLDSVTYEEAPIGLNAWICQRSRWIKGHIQTWAVYMRKPAKLLHAVKISGFSGFHVVMGMSWVSFLTAPVLWGVTISALKFESLYMAVSVVPWVQYIAAFNLVSFIFLCLAQGLLTARQKGVKFLFAAVTYPFYWVLHSIASYKALFQFITRPHYWEKTTHFVSKMK